VNAGRWADNHERFDVNSMAASGSTTGTDSQRIRTLLWDTSP